MNVYSNGTNLYGRYQCVELVNRLISARSWSPTIYGNANQIYGNASAARFVKHGNGSGYRPVQGDIVVWGGGWHGYGHVAVVEADGGGLLTVVEQNATPSGYGTYRISSSGYIARTSSGYYVEGYLHAKANHLGGGGESPSPGSAPQGKGGIGMYFPWDHSMHLRNSLSSGPSDYAFSYGASSGGVEGVPLVGDWNGNGRDGIGMYFPWDHSMHLRNSLSSGPSDYAFSYGASSGGVEGVPLVGDWNGQ